VEWLKCSSLSPRILRAGLPTGLGEASRRVLNSSQILRRPGPGRSGGVKGLPQAARVRPRALDAENDLVASEEQGNPALRLKVENDVERFRLDPSYTLHYKVRMNAPKRTLAAVELVLVLPGALFMLALFVRNLQPAPYEPAQAARRLVEWFSTRPLLGLNIFLVVLPAIAFLIGCATVLRSWRNDAELRQAALVTLAGVRAHLTIFLIAGATLMAGGILAVVAVHMIGS